MSKKHFQAIADAIRTAHTNCNTGMSEDVRRVVDATMSDVRRQVREALRGFNPAFDADRFIAACMPVVAKAK